jgi:hypothetical protein
MAIITKTLGSNEETIEDLSGDDVLVTNVASFQNQSRVELYWSTEPFSASNEGHVVELRDERIFSAVRPIYFRHLHKHNNYEVLRVHVTSILL